VAIVGEPGVGKSRLVWELTHRDPLVEWLILEAGASSYGRATSYLPVSMLLRSYFKLGEDANLRGLRREDRRAALRTRREPLARRASARGAPWGAVENAQWDGLDPRQRRQHTLDAARRLILRESQIQPLLLILEDLHWIDAETQAWLDGLVDALPAAHLLLLVTYRPEYQHAWGSRTNYTQLRVDPLPRKGAEDLLQALLGADPELDPEIAGADFFTTEVWTPRGLITYYTLFVLDLQSRRVHVVGSTPTPDAWFMVQAARRLTDAVDGFLVGHRVLICDRDRKWTDAFRRIVQSAGVRIVLMPIRAPNANAYAERFVRSIREECLDRLILFGERRLFRALDEFVAHYHGERNHQGLGNELITPAAAVAGATRVRCRDRLGGLLRYYHRAA
jgi:transposase InsO family protein